MKHLILVTALFALAACNKDGGDAKAPAAAASTAAKAAEAPKSAAPASAAATEAAVATVDMAGAQEIYTQRCNTCHGPEGKGDGPAGAALNPKARTFGDADWQAKVTDEHLTNVIIGGGPKVGLSPLMPPNPDLATRPAVVAGLVKMVRDFGGK